MPTTTFTITSIPYYDTYSQQYINVLSPNILPPGPLRERTRRLRISRPFNGEYTNNIRGGCRQSNCLLGLICDPIADVSCCNGCGWMTPNDLPDLITFLVSHGYTLDTRMTDMLNGSEVRTTFGKLVFVVTYVHTK